MTTGSPDAVIRSAGPEDAGTILRLLRELAAFQGLLDQARASEADILRDGFGERPCFECLLAEIDGEPSGLHSFTPSTRPSTAGRGFTSRISTLLTPHAVKGWATGLWLTWPALPWRGIAGG